jgi:acyl-CoA synthetase (AMP-forming)/AMP-acid ligase II
MDKNGTGRAIVTALRDISLQHMCEQSLARDSARPAIEYARKWTCWGELRAVADRLEALMRQGGISEAAPVVFVPRNRPSGVAAFLGMLARARTVRMAYSFQSAAAMARELAGLAPAVVVADAEDFSPQVCAVLRAHGAVGIMLKDMDVALVQGLERSRRDLPPPMPLQPSIEILTSGTTGAPKRFGLTYDMVARHIVGANKNYQAPDVDYSQRPPAFLYYPLGNISGIYSILPTLLIGHRMLLVERFSVEAWRDHICRYQPERASLPPAGLQMVLDADVPTDELTGVRSIATGAAPLEPSVHRAFEARYKIPVLQSYGATEFGGPVTSMTPELHAQWGERKFGSVGRPIAGARLRVVDAETGKTLPPGQEGILEVAVPRIGPDWIHTSDVALIDEDGFLFHRGRADGAITRGGFKLLPETIERALLLHSSVSAALVVGLPDMRLGQVPAAVVQIRRGASRPTPTDLERHLRDQVYATHIPVAWRFVDELPRTPSLKVDRVAAQRMFEHVEGDHCSGERDVETRHLRIQRDVFRRPDL